MRIRTRLSLAFLVLVGLGFYKLVDWTVDELRPRYLETMEESMIDTATILSASLEQKLNGNDIEMDDLRATLHAAKRREFNARIYQVTKDYLNMRVYVTDRNGRVVFDSDNGRDEGKDYSQWNDVLLTMRGQYGARTTRGIPEDPRTAVLCVGSPVKSGDTIVGVLTVCKPADSVTLFLDMARKKIMTAGAVAALVVVLFGIVISSWITWPIQKLTNYAKAIRDGRRVSAPKLGHSELGQLGEAFEEMRDALEGKQYAETYVQTLTHEMKSPLSAIRGAAELLEEEMPTAQKKRFLDNIRAESTRIQDIVDRLLQLSAIEKRKELHDVESIDLSALVKDILESAQPVASSKNITLTLDGAAPIHIAGERFLVRQSISNLLQNAIDFSPAGGNVTVTLAQDGTNVSIRITDRGAGIPDYALDKVFDRFYSLRRPDTGKKSSGLGLTFVREVAALHGGAVRIENGCQGGVSATLILPVASC